MCTCAQRMKCLLKCAGFGVFIREAEKPFKMHCENNKVFMELKPYERLLSLKKKNKKKIAP